MVALVRGGETLQSWILEPALERLALAERGAGTEVDGARARLTPLAPDARCDGMARGGASWARWRPSRA